MVRVFVVLAVVSCGCRDRSRDDVEPTPASESSDARRDATSIATVASADATPQVDPCGASGPRPGNPCDTPGAICLRLELKELVEIRCDGQYWAKEEAHALPPVWPPGVCPKTEPTSGDPCIGRAECRYHPCIDVDPATGETIHRDWLMTWICYDGAWRRRTDSCYAE